MNKPSHVYRTEKEADRIIQLFALPPTREAREATRQALLRERANLVSREKGVNLPERRQRRSNGRER